MLTYSPYIWLQKENVIWCKYLPIVKLAEQMSLTWTTGRFYLQFTRKKKKQTKRFLHLKLYWLKHDTKLVLTYTPYTWLQKEYVTGLTRGEGGSGIPVYSKKIHQNTQKYPKFIQIYPKLYPGILYTWNSKKVIYRIPVLSCNIPYTRFKKPLYTLYPKTLADPDFKLANLFEMPANSLVSSSLLSRHS